MSPRAAQLLGAPVLGTLLGVAAWLGACSDSGGPLDPVVMSQGSDSAIVSDPVPTPPSGAHASFSVVGSASIDLAYVSLQPGTVPEGELVTIRSPRTTGTVTAAMTGGGFDPLPIAANAGDSVQVAVSAGGRDLVSFMRAVPTTRRPVVIRTDPPPGKRDQPLNARIVVVFSEPVAGATLTTASVQLLRGTSPVAGTVSLLQGSTTAAVFEPSAPLDPNTGYRLIVTQGVRDLEGDALTGDTTVEFATGTTVEGPVSSITLFPDSAQVLVGSQYQLTATARDAGGYVITGQPVSWTSFDTVVATVSSTGLVTALAEGIGSFSAEVEGKTGYSTLYVNATLVPVASLAVTPHSPTVFVYRTVELVAEAKDGAGNVLLLRPVAWSSSNPAVATVALSPAKGRAVVTGVAQGVARIAATVEGKSDTAVVTVQPGPPFVGFTVSPDTVTTIPHGRAHLTGLARAADGWVGPIEGSQIAWTSSDPSVVSVDGTGVLVGLQPGSATITATWSGFTATARVTVVSLNFVTVSAGYLHACGLTSSGAAFCWGYNWAGALGNGTTSASASPVPVAGGLAFAAISAGGNHTCALAVNAVAYCWGYNGHGEVGDGTNTDTSTPVAVAGGLTFQALSAGTGHTCGLTASGTAYCWGQNWDGITGGRLGDGTMTSRSLPVPVLGGLSFTALTAGGEHTCGVTTSGAGYCWGSNYAGELGNGTTGRNGALTPVPVSGGLRFAALGAGESSTCGLTSTDAAYCWGANNYGQLGNGTLTDSPAPVAVAGGLTFASLSVGGSFPSHGCGLTSSGTAYCWSRNSSGELGDGTLVDSSRPVAVMGGLTFASVSAGDAASCGVTVRGVAYCWGGNYYGQLGNGSTADSGVPVKVAGQP